MAAGTGGAQIALIIYGVILRFHPLTSEQLAEIHVKPENIGFYACTSIIKESKFDYAIENLCPRSNYDKNIRHSQNFKTFKNDDVMDKYHLKSSFIILLLLSGDIASNPGPANSFFEKSKHREVKRTPVGLFPFV